MTASLAPWGALPSLLHNNGCPRQHFIHRCHFAHMRGGRRQIYSPARVLHRIYFFCVLVIQKFYMNDVMGYYQLQQSCNRYLAWLSSWTREMDPRHRYSRSIWNNQFLAIGSGRSLTELHSNCNIYFLTAFSIKRRQILTSVALSLSGAAVNSRNYVSDFRRYNPNIRCSMNSYKAQIL